MFELVAPLNEVNVGGHLVEQSIVAYINDASRATGIDFDYLLAKAYQESAFSSHASSDTTSASGMYQFTAETWLFQIMTHGKKYGYGNLAEKITRGKRGCCYVKDRVLRKAILDLRWDAKLASLMAAEYAKDNKSYLEKVTKRKITSSDLYVAHFLGPHGASVLINAESKGFFNVLPAADLFPDAAKANRSVFYKKNGTPYTVSEVRENLENLFLKGVKRFSELPEEILATLPNTFLKRYTDLSLVAPVEEEISRTSYKVYALDEIQGSSNYAYYDFGEFNDYSYGYNLDGKFDYDYASLDDGITRTSYKVP